MYADPAVHPLAEDTMPPPPLAFRQKAGLPGMGVPADPVTGRGVRPVSGVVDPFETRTYNGVVGATLSEHAADIWNMLQGAPCREGAAQRAYARLEVVLATAVWAYITVRNALTLLARPLRPKVAEARGRTVRSPHKAQAPRVWVTPPPTEAAWKARDHEAGFDIRGTSPTCVRRRIYVYRAQRRRVLAPDFEPAARRGARRRAAEFIGPPAPRHYQELEDIGMIWPPVPRPSAPQGLLPPVRAAEFIEATARDSLSADIAEEADALIEGYNYALEQFGEEATYNYLRGLREDDVEFMDRYIRAHRAWQRRTGAHKRGPP